MARKLYSIAKLNQIAKEIEFDKQKALNLIMENGRKELQKYVKAYWYDAYSPSYYDRTYEFLNCVKARFINDDEVEIYYDTAAISSSFLVMDIGIFTQVLMVPLLAGKVLLKL